MLGFSPSRHAFSTDNPQRLALLAFAVLYLFAFLYLFHAASRDPTSLFFSPSHAYDEQYSAIRKEQAEYFINSTINAPSLRTSNAPPRLALGIATIKREGQRYFRTAVGSVLEGLGEAERQNIHLTTLIANVDPSVHPAFHEPWLPRVSDRVLTYNDVSEDERQRMSDLATTDTRNLFKPMLDYIFLLETCYNTGADYVVLLEDDVIGVDGWYHRTVAGLQGLERRGELQNAIYLRLFHNSGLLGWNGERWRFHLFWSSSVAVAVAFAIYTLQRRSGTMKRFLTLRTSMMILCVCTPMVIGLYYAAGRLTIAPLPLGVQRMDTHGCCSQAFAFPRHQVPDLIQYYRARGTGLIDELTEEYANERGLSRWAMVPSVFQHVGATSSKSGGSVMRKYNRSGPGLIWNFDFELFNPVVLHAEHRAVLGT